MADLPIDDLTRTLRETGICRFLEHFAARFPTTHLKDLVVDACGPDRTMRVNGRDVVNFGSDSFLGLDQDPRVQDAIQRGVAIWGTHNGTSRAFSSVRANEDAEEKLARWLGTEATLIYPSVTLANMGAIPGIVGRQDVLVLDEHAHNSMQEGAKIAKGNGVPVHTFAHNDAAALDRLLTESKPYRLALVAIDGVYSMTGDLPPLRDLQAVAQRHHAVLYIDDAHGTGVLGGHGRGTVLDGLGNYDNTLVVGSLSKAFSCLGGFIGCSAAMKYLLKMRSNTFIFGGPVPPPYLDAICTVTDILTSDEYTMIRGRLDANVRRLTAGLHRMGLVVLGGLTPIISILVGDEAATLQAGWELFERGFYVQSVTFPAVPYHAGVLRIQINANHPTAAIDRLLHAVAGLQETIPLPRADEISRRAA
ncbi:hypothetical protein AYO44_04850 [Planctomycetaceae bacterium SCGC AG-212-F19]|nr:hypothetical protein AYO44_04850 [Planctomycetaceae bacterium SCGC AG-212-F19]